MAYVDPRYLEHQRKRFTRHNARLYIRHDAERFFLPGTCPEELKPHYRKSSADRQREAEAAARAGELALEAATSEHAAQVQERRSIEWNMAALRLQRAWLHLGIGQQKAHNPNQPRVPKYNPGGGQWTRGDSSTDFSGARKPPPIVEKFGKWTARQFISRFCRASIKSEMPSQFDEMEIADIWNIAKGGDARARTCLKLLQRKEYRK